ncbi:CopL family metal-binding regulatory protein [Shewanella frigidimarina]|uniref:CopL family metal-binding regulatory protein n=1 Tax=Shewanella frigidimarina TaxID=56812 RepID=UPI003D7BC79E
MRAKQSNYWIIVITLFALVGQGLLTNDSLMVPMAHAEMTQALSAQTDKITNTTSTMSHKAMKNCHDNMQNIVNDMDEPIAAKLPQNSCCNGSGFCSLDCNHCLTISFTANLIDIPLVTTHIPVYSAPLAMAVSRVSIAFPPAFRPPIA